MNLDQGPYITINIGRTWLDSSQYSSLASGVDELRVRDRSGAYRVFYYTKLADSVLIFHAFAKKTQKTPPQEIALAQKRLREMFDEESRPVVARNARELAKVLGLPPAEGMEIEFRSDMNDKIIEVVGKKGLTHSDVARLAHTSRTRVTAILNRNTHDISIDLMLRVLGSLGIQAKLQFRNAA